MDTNITQLVFLLEHHQANINNEAYPADHAQREEEELWCEIQMHKKQKPQNVHEVPVCSVWTLRVYKVCADP